MPGTRASSVSVAVASASGAAKPWLKSTRARIRPTPGSASMWREWNMAHHLTRVVRDLAAMSGVEFEEEVEHPEPEQIGLFADI